jgi:hypothetical protein
MKLIFTQNLVSFSIYYITVYGTNKFILTLITLRNYFCLFNKMYISHVIFLMCMLIVLLTRWLVYSFFKFNYSLISLPFGEKYYSVLKHQINQNVFYVGGGGA